MVNSDSSQQSRQTSSQSKSFQSKQFSGEKKKNTPVVQSPVRDILGAAAGVMRNFCSSPLFPGLFCAHPAEERRMLRRSGGSAQRQRRTSVCPWTRAREGGRMQLDHRGLLRLWAPRVTACHRVSRSDTAEGRRPARRLGSITSEGSTKVKLSWSCASSNYNLDAFMSSNLIQSLDYIVLFIETRKHMPALLFNNVFWTSYLNWIFILNYSKPLNDLTLSFMPLWWWRVCRSWFHCNSLKTDQLVSVVFGWTLKGAGRRTGYNGKSACLCAFGEAVEGIKRSHAGLSRGCVTYGAL